MERTRMKPNPYASSCAVAALLPVAVLGGCATSAPAATDLDARQAANDEKQKQLKEMERIGQRN